MELFRYTTSKKFMYFGKRKCMVESCVPLCKRQLFSCDEEINTDDVSSQYQESLASNQNKDWVTCLKSNLDMDCTVSMNKFQLYLEVLNKIIETSESETSDCESIGELEESDWADIDVSDSDIESIEALESDCENTNELDYDFESIASESDLESIEASESDFESIQASESDIESIEASESDLESIEASESDFESIQALEYSNIAPEHFENSGTLLYDSGIYSDSSVNFGSEWLSSDACSDLYFHSDDIISHQDGDVNAEGQYHNNDVMFCQAENVIAVSEMQWVTSPEVQTTDSIGYEFVKNENFVICNDLMPMSDYYNCPNSISNELFPVDFMEE